MVEPGPSAEIHRTIKLGERPDFIGTGVPFVDGDLTGENGRTAPIAFLEYLVKVTTGTGVQRFEAPEVDPVCETAGAAS